MGIRQENCKIGDKSDTFLPKIVRRHECALLTGLSILETSGKQGQLGQGKQTNPDSVGGRVG